jgi:hypothetical protein
MTDRYPSVESSLLCPAAVRFHKCDSVGFECGMPIWSDRYAPGGVGCPTLQASLKRSTVLTFHKGPS